MCLPLMSRLCSAIGQFCACENACRVSCSHLIAHLPVQPCGRDSCFAPDDCQLLLLLRHPRIHCCSNIGQLKGAGLPPLALHTAVQNHTYMQQAFVKHCNLSPHARLDETGRMQCISRSSWAQHIPRSYTVRTSYAAALLVGLESPAPDVLLQQRQQGHAL
jgi:hypothetical protein